MRKAGISFGTTHAVLDEWCKLWAGVKERQVVTFTIIASTIVILVCEYKTLKKGYTVTFKKVL